MLPAIEQQLKHQYHNQSLTAYVTHVLNQGVTDVLTRALRPSSSHLTALCARKAVPPFQGYLRQSSAPLPSGLVPTLTPLPPGKPWRPVGATIAS